MLGTGFEALDPIRMYHLCHIVHDRHVNILKIFANSDEQVRSAIGSIENAVLEFRASNSVPLETRVVHPPDTVAAKRYIGTEGNREGGYLEKIGILRLYGEALTTQEGGLWERKRHIIVGQNQLKMQSTTIQALNRVCFYRGKVQIRIQFGSFTIRGLGWKPSETVRLPLQRFFSDLDRYAPEGDLDQW